MKIGDKVRVIGQSLTTPRKGQEGIFVALRSSVYDCPYRVEFPDELRFSFMRKELEEVK